MNKHRIRAACFFILLSLMFSGCWNYHEINQVTLVAGMAVDKLSDGRFLLTLEWVDPAGGKEGKTEPKIMHSEGATVFDAVRNAIKTTGKKLYFSHTKLVVISQGIAKTGITPVLDWVTRDAEPRLELYIAISKEKTASEILDSAEEPSKSIKSYEIANILKTQSSVAKSTNIPVYRLINAMSTEGVSATIPVIGISKTDDKKNLDISGSAILKGDKYVGMLNEDETKYLLFLRNRIHNPLLIEMVNSKMPNVSLEVFNSKTKVTPKYADEKLAINIKINTEAAISEIYNGVDFVDENNRAILKKESEEHLENDLSKLIKKVQKDYGTDIFGFAALTKANLPSLWKSIGKNWEQVFRTLDVNVVSDIKIRNEGVQGKPVRVGG